MHKLLVRILGAIAGILGVAGLFVNYTHILGLINADLLLDFIRVGLAGLMIYVGFWSDTKYTLKGALTVFALTYLAIGTLGMIDLEIFGLLPTGLTVFDVFSHLGIGMIAITGAITAQSDNMVHA